MKIIKLTILAAILGFNFNALAGGDVDACGRLEVELANNTNDTCALTDQSLYHGNLISGSRVPAMVWPGQTAIFELTQTTVFGPGIDLQYRCGQGTIKLRTSQGYCYGYAGSANGEVLMNHDLIAHHVIQNPSRLYNTEGIVKWIIAKSHN